MTEEINIFVDHREFDFAEKASRASKSFKVDSESSVSRIKKDFFEILAQIGRISKFREKEIHKDCTFAKALASPRSLVACFHERPPQLPCRLLQHTKGGLMLTGGFLDGWLRRQATVNLVETEQQKNQIRKSLGSFIPKLGVFAHSLSTQIYRPPYKTEYSNKKCSDQNPLKTLLYAGRLIPNKGITQIIRCLNLCPKKNTRLKIIGDYEPFFLNSQSGTTCANFDKWFKIEVIGKNKHLPIEILDSMTDDKLVKQYWSSDAFVLPSFHEDEALGYAAHEAVLCGLPAIVTDWCGLGQLGNINKNRKISTYASLGGVRYSLYELRKKISSILACEDSSIKEQSNDSINWVKSKFSHQRMKSYLEKAVNELLKTPVEKPPSGGWRCQNRLNAIIKDGPRLFTEALSHKSTSDHQSLYAYGTGFQNEDFSEARFLTAIQGMYTSFPSIPEIKPGIWLHGFWRVNLWEDEKALVEFGYPGPRVLPFNSQNWKTVLDSSKKAKDAKDEVTFFVKNHETCKVLQIAVDLGFLVPMHVENFLFES